MAENYFETFLAKAGSIPGIRVDREAFLRKTFEKSKFNKHMDGILQKGPLETGISLKTVGRMADESIMAEAVKTITLSTAAGMPGGWGMAATIPADILQFYAHSFRVIQKLMYLYGYQDDIFDGDGNIEDETVTMLVLYLGVMSGVGLAGKALADLTRTAAKKMVWEISKTTIKKFFTNKTFRKIVLKIIQIIGAKTSTKYIISIPGKAIPVIGGVTSGLLTAVFFVPASKKLKKYFETGELERIEAEELDSEE